MSVTACATRHILENIRFFSDEILVILARRHLAERMELRLLNDKEQARYHAYVFEADKQRHLLAHALKRQILSKLTGLASASLQFNCVHIFISLPTSSTGLSIAGALASRL